MQTIHALIQTDKQAHMHTSWLIVLYGNILEMKVAFLNAHISLSVMLLLSMLRHKGNLLTHYFRSVDGVLSGDWNPSLSSLMVFSSGRERLPGYFTDNDLWPLPRWSFDQSGGHRHLMLSTSSVHSVPVFLSYFGYILPICQIVINIDIWKTGILTL